MQSCQEPGAADSREEPSSGNASLIETKSSTAAVPNVITREQSIPGDSKTPPSTPLSTRTTLSSQTSTGRSRYNRKFNQKWLATPSSGGTGSPISKMRSSSRSPPKSPSRARASAPPNLNSNPPSPMPQPSVPAQFSSRRMEQNPTAASLQYTSTVPSITSYYSQMVGGVRLAPGPAYGYAPHFPYNPPSSYPPNNPSSVMAYNTSPAHNTSPPYGGEARHHVPIGVNPSPPMARNPAYDTHAIAPTEPNIPEYPRDQIIPKKPVAKIDSGTAAKKKKKEKKHWWR